MMTVAPDVPRSHVVAVALVEAPTMLSLAAPCDTFGAAPPPGAASWYDFRVCGGDSVPLGPWGRLDPTDPPETLDIADTIVVPGVGGARFRDLDPLVDALRAAHARGARVISICTGAFVLARAGLLDGRRATTHWHYARRLAELAPTAVIEPDRIHVDDGDVLTSAGNAAGLDLCLYVLQRDHGAAVANAVARRLVMAPHRDGGQAQFVAHRPGRDRPDDLAALCDWAIARLDQPLRVADLAARAGLSTRQLGRRFRAATGQGTLDWLAQARVRRAQELLETTGDTVEVIAARTGHGSAANLRRHFRDIVGVAPDAYRRTFRHGA